MRQQIIKTLKIVAIFMSGLIVGVVLMNVLHMYVRPLYRETIRTNLKAEQELLAGDAARRGDKLRAVSHRWNVVDTEAEDGFRVFGKEWNKEIDSSFLFPFYMVALHAMVHPKEGMKEKASRISEGVDRGRLALSLESIGAREEADRQWEMARILTNRQSVEDVKKLIFKLQGKENTDTYRQVEEEQSEVAER